MGENVEKSTLDSSKVAKRRVVRANYKRQPKPPYTYLGLAVMAIELSPAKMLTLAEIQDSLEKMFQFFAGSYKGWKDSIRHNLSANACFVKVDKHGVLTNKSKKSFWAVDLSFVPRNAFKRQDNKFSVNAEWALNLHDQLGVQPVFLADGTVSEYYRPSMATPSPNSNTAGHLSPYSDISSPEMSDNIAKESALNFGIASILNNCDKVDILNRFNPSEEYDLQRDASPCSDDSFITSAAINPAKRQRTSTEPSTSSTDDSIMKLLASSVQQFDNQDAAAQNLKLLCQHYDFGRSENSATYYAQYPWDNPQVSFDTGYFSCQPYPYSNMCYPPVPNYVNYQFAPYYSSSFLPQTMYPSSYQSNYAMVYGNSFADQSDLNSCLVSPPNTSSDSASASNTVSKERQMCSPDTYVNNISPISVCGVDTDCSNEVPSPLTQQQYMYTI